MNYSSNTQLKAFLDHKLEEIQAATKNDLTRSDEFVNALSLQTGEINGYRTKHINERNFSLLGCDGGWRISINASCHIDMSFEKKGQSLRVVNSIKTWLKEILKSLPYSYYTIETEHKITLSIKLKRNMQLDIPIFYSRFQSIMPHIEETVRKYEAMANGNKIKALITNSTPNHKWNTPLNS